jgi:hypothetical protein
MKFPVLSLNVAKQYSTGVYQEQHLGSLWLGRKSPLGGARPNEFLSKEVGPRYALKIFGKRLNRGALLTVREISTSTINYSRN